MWFWERYTSPFKLATLGIMGMNQRNVNYIGRYNQRSLYPLVDNKLKTKRIAVDAGVTVPKLIGTIQHQHEVGKIAAMVKEWSGFCIKPARGSGGKGILVIVRQADGLYYKPNGTPCNAGLALCTLPGVEVVTGVSMPVLVEAFSQRQTMDAATLAAAVVEKGKESLVLASRLFRQRMNP